MGNDGRVRGRVARVLIRKRGQVARVSVQPDQVIVEEPLEIRLDGHLVSTTMRTPGHDFELAAGFLHGEGMLDALAGAVPVRTIRSCATGSAVDTEFNVVEIDPGGMAPVPTPRLGHTTSSCGLCGSESIESLAARLQPFPVATEANFDVLATVPERVRQRQELFETTGSVHAAAAFDLTTGEPTTVREDVGRHNAVDKVAGRLLLDGHVPASGQGLFVSGRASFEMVQKAWAAGFPLVLAVSGPTSLAVETARRANLTLVGFVRGSAMNLYSPAPHEPSRP